MAIWDQWLKNRVRGQIEELLKADGVSAQTEVPPGGVSSFASPETPAAANGDVLPDIPEKDHDAKKHLGRKAFTDDPYFDLIGSQVNYKFKLTRISNKTLKEVSVRDWLISAIIQCRVDTLLTFSRPEHRRFEKGFRIIKRDAESHYTDEEKEEIANIEDFVYHCGRKEGTPADDKRLFGEFLKCTARDALTFGHVAIEKVKTRAGGLHRFRPLPAESIYLINKALSKEQVNSNAMKSYQLTKPKSNNDPKADQVVNEVENDYIKYVQVSYDNRPLATFGDEDCIFRLFNPQNFADSMGYCYSPLELAIINITNHLNVENYNANFFTHGYAARGVLHLKGTVTQAQLANFRRTFYNSITGHQNAWRTPIVAGLDEVQWVPMSANAKEMEYLNYNNHLMRILCAQFQIDPVELGLDYLISANGRAPMQQASNEYKIIYSRERGLVPLLMFVEDIMNNDVLHALDPTIAAKYKFVFTGMTDETPQTEIAQMQAEMAVWKTMNDLLQQAQKDKIEEKVADLPLNQAFWVLVEKNYTRGEIRELFLGDKGASKRRELQYIPGDPSFLNWNQFIATLDAQKKQEAQMAQQQDAATQEAQMKMAQEQQKHQHAEAAHGRDKEKHNLEMEQIKAKAASDAVQHGLKETAKQFGASQATHVGGQTIKNPLNHSEE
jgi:hypothetical protein